jgi:Putative zinc-finger
MSGKAGRRCPDALAEYAAGVLAGPERAAIEAHLLDCASCRAALVGWTAVAEAVTAPAETSPEPTSVVRATLTQAALAPQPPPVRGRRAAFAGELLLAELRLVRPSVWLASVLVMACAVALALTAGNGAGATVLSLVAPLVAVAGVAGVYGPERDPAFEALAVTATSPQVVLLARVTLVFVYDLVLAVAASAVVHLGAAGVGLVDLVAGWLGPMALLSALSLLLAMWVGPNVSVAVAASLWVLRALTIGVPQLGDRWLAAAMRQVWATNPGTLAATLTLLAAAVLLSRQRLRPGGWPGALRWGARG